MLVIGVPCFVLVQCWTLCIWQSSSTQLQSALLRVKPASPSQRVFEKFSSYLFLEFNAGEEPLAIHHSLHVELFSAMVLSHQHLCSHQDDLAWAAVHSGEHFTCRSASPECLVCSTSCHTTSPFGVQAGWLSGSSGPSGLFTVQLTRHSCWLLHQICLSLSSDHNFLQ